ncbi:MBL fold metallo-hydrolase [Bermanella marisrubri]|uniref:Metallo-beta-lactamase domain-containing protein n=1 Tax=Bermanella marisrubri TaxID=207949 RepID=Q1N055_9GAMM|nr:MBL fold metallo-hydrolase [Bermanella marisrubri]EAT11662.1 hypothetical protein RED65_08234 [Oceanobacter sp. RED65] [Bermanella marisrubri]
MVKFVLAIVLASMLLSLLACAGKEQKQYQSDHYKDGKFINLEPFEKDYGFARTIDIINKFWFTEFPFTEPDRPIPTQTLTPEQIEQAPNGTLYRLGHSTVLMKLSGKLILTDPMFSERASPFQWIGPKRFHAPPISIEELPPIDFVLISHDHYDHLDESTIEQLHEKVGQFFVPLKVGRYLLDFGVPKEKVQEFDWWQEATVGPFRIAATPSNHFSGRGLFNRDETLWVSWVIIDEATRIYFSGDSGYFSGFKEIGERYGPFDVTIMENGAYNPDWAHNHMFPDGTVKGHQDLQGKRLLPVHNGTFKLAFHPWFEPMQQVSDIAKREQVSVLYPMMGQPVHAHKDKMFDPWWWLPQRSEATDGFDEAKMH